MKKKVFKFSIFIIIAVLILLLGILCILKIKEKKIINEKIQIFQNFCALSLVNNNEFCTNSLSDKPILIMFIHPECDYCREEIKQLKQNQDKVENIFILLITYASKEEAIDFYVNQELSQLTNIQFLFDEKMKISNYFDVNMIPSIFLYDAKEKLIYNGKGEIKIETLLKYLSE
jgi:thioredoxin-related protein